MISIDVLDRTINKIRTIKKHELANAGDGSRGRLVPLGEIANQVDRALVQVSEALKEALDDEYQDEEIDRRSWWGDSHPGYHAEFPSDWYRGGITEDYPLPRVEENGER